MSGRYRRHSQGDDDVAREGDAIFLGMQSKLSPDKIPPGYCRELVNKSCRTGRAATRPGMATILQLNPLLQGALFVSNPQAAGTYTDPTGVEWLLLVCTGIVWKMRADSAPVQLAGPAELGATTELIQFNTVVILFRGEGLTPWVWDGAGTSFVEMDQTPPVDGTLVLPGAIYGEVIDNRLVVTQGREGILFTEILRYNNYDPLTAYFRAQQGEDAIVRVLPFSGNSALVFKTRSIYLLDGITGDLTNATLTEVNRNLGLSGRKACVAVGADVWFLSRTGVFRISQVVQDRIATQPVPVSDPIEPFFRERVNWNAVNVAVMQVHEEYVYLAVPIDGATANNALLLYNTATEAWEGHWTFPSFPQDAIPGPGLPGPGTAPASITDLVKIEVRGQERLLALDSVNGYTYLFGEGLADRVADVNYEIEDVLETRGYLLGDPGHKAIPRCDATFSTWRPSYSVTANFDGANESRTLVTSRTRSRSRYYIHGRADYDLTNTNDDHGLSRREDYSMQPTPPFQLGDNGVVVEQQQSASEQWPIREPARWVSLRITNNQGFCAVEACGVQGIVQDRSLKTKV